VSFASIYRNVPPCASIYLPFQVPLENLIGDENRGFYYIMANFNHERFVLAAQARLGRASDPSQPHDPASLTPAD